MTRTRKLIKIQKSILLMSLIGLFSFTGDVNSAERQKVSLNGIWDFKWDNEYRLSYPPEGTGW